MAFPSTPKTSHPLLNPPLSSFTSLTLTPKSYFQPLFKPFNFKPYCSSLSYNNNTTQSQSQTQHGNTNFDAPKKKRKPRPSFYEKIREKWSAKPVSNTKKLPWQLHEHEQELVGQSASLFGKVVGVTNFEEPVVGFGGNEEERLSDRVARYGVDDKLVSCSFDEENGVKDDKVSHIGSVVFDEENEVTDDKFSHIDENCSKKDHSVGFDEKEKVAKRQISVSRKDHGVVEIDGNLGNNVAFEQVVEGRSKVNEFVEVSRVKDGGVTLYGSENGVHIWNDKDKDGDRGTSERFVRRSGAGRLPWEPEIESDRGEEEWRKRGKTAVAENMIPEHELKRLRNVALRMKERVKVGAAGVTQAVVSAIHEKWKIDEVVKLKFEGPSTLNMKRMHDVLESKTGGLVIWRSGSSVVLYRGLTYKLDCVQTYIKEKVETSDVPAYVETSVPGFGRLNKNLSEEELVEMNELNELLDELGPRFVDWSGRPPLPVDADLLPGVVPGYKTPFRLLPHGVRNSLRDTETTSIRRQARFMPPHFALGRNRELQGLAAAMVKLWEKNAIAKIAIKRGVLNTWNERMAEELKKLTGGTLLSRNKEFIVFYRGNDFLPPPVTESLRERERLTMLQYQEEDARRYASPLLNSNLKNSKKIPMVAGTLAETVAATSRWAKQGSSEDVKRMLKDSAIGRRTSLVNYLQKKLAMAKGKLKKAEKALEKVQEYLEPEDLPTDLELITDEERLVFRKMGLSMKPHLLLGRREVFDGTIENMHMHWKFRELVKIIVRGKNFAQVKHIAISLEAESGGVLVSLDKTTKGYAIIVYRGKNYKQPVRLKPRNLLTRRQALARSIELQRREGLKHHISSLQEQMELVISELEGVKGGKELDDKTFYGKLDDTSIPYDEDIEEDDDDDDDDDDEEAYLQTYDSGDEKDVV